MDRHPGDGLVPARVAIDRTRMAKGPPINGRPFVEVPAHL